MSAPGRPLKVFLDDERPAPPGWTLVRWPAEVIALLETGRVVALSLDHDLGDASDIRSGYAVLQWLERAVATRDFRPPAELAVHSANVAARVRMEAAIAAIRRLARDGRDPPQ